MATPALQSTPDFAAAHARVCALCDHFDANRAEVMAAAYKEAHARDQFITPFFEALGWDVRNTAHRSVYEKDVVTEKREDIAGTARSADYAFRRPGTHLTAFFVEAKKPSVDIRHHDPCYQAVLYGWNASTPLVVLTDFEQLLILDARSEPDRANASRHVLKANGSYTHRDYRDPDKFAELWGLLARERVAAGSLDKAAAALPRLSGRVKKDDLFARGTGPVDETFLAQMELWREKLAKSLKRTNHDLDGERLTSLTQRILDRLVFLRFLEDRGIERDVRFASIGQSGSAWRDFLKISRRLDARYNGIIYKKDPHGCEDPALAVDDPTFAAIAEKFAPENSSYLFDKISITILGSIYERFLGNVITARDKTAIVEPKPEVRKAGGVYYTPDYIVRYIVAQTVGRCLAGKKPTEIEALRFADIACGSGSFLVEVFACLIRYHLAWYLADDPAKWEKKGVLRRREIDGDYVLTLGEKRRILLANVYGVDLDYQAHEVTQLSLYLRLMEDESFPSTQSLFDFEKHALLPDLRNNIRCGNSIIEDDISGLLGLSAEDEEKIKPLNLRGAFPKVFAHRSSKSSVVKETGADEFILIGAAPTHGNLRGPRRKTESAVETVAEREPGFDAIVGNPPYIRIQSLREIIPQTPKYCGEHYAAAAKGNYDIYVVFIERAAKLLSPKGRLGYIVPNKFFRTDYGAGLRGWLSKAHLVERIVDFGHTQVFDATTYTNILILDAERPNAFEYGVAEANEESLAQCDFASFPASYLTGTPWTFAEDTASALMERLKGSSQTLLELGIEMNRGSSTGDDEVFILPPEADVEPELTRIAVHATDFTRYGFAAKAEKRVLLPYDIANGARLYSERQLAKDFPKALAYLLANKTRLRKRKQFTQWFGYSAPRSLKSLDAAQMVVPLLANRGLCALIPKEYKGRLCFMASGGFTLTFPEGIETDPRFVLALINSRLLFWCLQQSSNLFRGGWITCTKQYFGELPIKNLATESDRALHDGLIEAVDKMQRAMAGEANANASFKREYWRQRISAHDREIDALVYELYGLTDEEIALVKGAS